MLLYAEGTQQAWAGTLPSPTTRLMPGHMKSRGDLPPQLVSWLLLPGSISVITVPMRSEEGEQDPGRVTHSPGISQHQGLVAYFFVSLQLETQMQLDSNPPPQTDDVKH